MLVDLYELTMAQSELEHGLTAPATFSLFARHLPPGWGYFVSAGLDDVLSYLEHLAVTESDLAYLATTGKFSKRLLDWLRGVKFSGSVRALPEGTVFFPQEPLLEVTAPLIEAQLVETAVLNMAHFQSLVATKAARCVLAAHGKRLVDFGARRTHGSDAALKAARSAYLAGFDATSNIDAGQHYGIPVAGTMAHAYVQAFGDELAAFRAYAESYPDSCVLLIDTYDTLEGARRAAIVGRELTAIGHRLQGVRLDSGDLIGLSFAVRTILDEAGLQDATIFASGSLDEHAVAEAVARRAPIDAFGVGTRLGTCADAPYLDMAYKLVAYDGRPVVKLSTGKATWPGAKQVWRSRCPDGSIHDEIGTIDENTPAGSVPLLVEAMREGERVWHSTLADARERARAELAALPLDFRSLVDPCASPVIFTPRLRALRDQLTAVAAHV